MAHLLGTGSSLPSQIEIGCLTAAHLNLRTIKPGTLQLEPADRCAIEAECFQDGCQGSRRAGKHARIDAAAQGTGHYVKGSALGKVSDPFSGFRPFANAHTTLNLA